MLGLVLDLLEDPKEDLVRWANRSESCLKEWRWIGPAGGDLRVPSFLRSCGDVVVLARLLYSFFLTLCMHGGEDLLERGWGWDSLVTSESSPEDMPTYKKYLKDYYSHNTAESVAQAWQNEHQRDANTASNGTGVGTVLLPTLANLCIEAEEKFIYKRRMYKLDFTTDEINLSKKIQEGFITKEAELMCEWLEIGTYDPHLFPEWCIPINIARRCALDFMAYKGPESISVAGLLMGIAKERKTIYEAIRQDPCGSRKGSSTAILLDGINTVWELTSNTVEEDVQNVESEDEMPKRPIGQKAAKKAAKRAALAAKGKSKAMGDDGKLKESAIDVGKLDKLSKIQEANANRMKVLELQQKLSFDKIETTRLAHLTAQENRESEKLEMERRLEMESKKLVMEGTKLEKESKMMEAITTSSHKTQVQ
ncbi:unnamed protein product [Miscanthus lutarioriparius]|uniref:Uncharacterized protein n=1 Tax=Miscanthus lutarioriparius TaxID=422564 RepID=A0A811SKB3_9POAL|nr:unnamed protein product [Miscanthus lutarioriparius]